MFFRTSLFTFLVLFSLTSFAQKTLIILGDSLTEGYGVTREQAYPTLLEKKILAAGKKWKVTNAGVSGSTTASGPTRLKWLLKSKPQMVMIALGSNDGLRGVDLKATEKNLANTIELVQAAKAQVILAGMLMPPNYGEAYRSGFEKIFKNLASKYKIHLVPFLLDKVAGNMDLNQTDGIHPNAKGHEIVAETVFNSIKDLL